ncbi:MAG: hypothetical protein KC731_15450 [Myxococcales bacterium]|nr:hypothetical protein [Myxococcales bacterium]
MVARAWVRALLALIGLGLAGSCSLIVDVDEDQIRGEGGSSDGGATAPSCDDGRHDGSETDVDCGGPDCGPCDHGDACETYVDCASRRCSDLVCVPCNGDADCKDSGRLTDCIEHVCTNSGLALNGEACSEGSDCRSEICVDELCCDAVCDGPCEACDLTGSLGSCRPVPDGTPGDGTCAPYLCTGSASGCPTSCATSGDCTEQAFCNDDHLCKGTKPLAEPCINDAECASLFCTDGVCCVVDDCPGVCSSCSSSGIEGSCQPLPNSVVCRPNSGGGCDVAETCTGSAPDCPADAFLPATTICRANTGLGCDVAETCSGSSGSCPPDSLQPSGAVCRPLSGNGCDVAETCSGSSDVCPPDGVQAAGTVCRPKSGNGCDVEETCDGSSDICPPDSVAAKWTICRPDDGNGCDQKEICDGSSDICPPDAFLSMGTLCRADAGVCDVAETCSGSSSSCPVDGFEPLGTPCDDALFCNGVDKCDGGGQCTHAGDPCELSMTCNEITDTCVAVLQP